MPDGRGEKSFARQYLIVGTKNLSPVSKKNLMKSQDKGA